MTRICRWLLSMLLTQLSCFATAAELVGGPWLLLGPDGSWNLGLELSVPLDEAGLATAVLLGDAAEAGAWAVPLQRPLQRPLHPSTTLLRWRLPAELAGRRFRVRIADREHVVALPELPGPTTDCVLAVATGNAYPSRADLDAIRAGIGRDIDLVVLLGGRGTARTLGTGAWETTIPTAVVLDRPPQDPALASLLGEHGWWGEHLACGTIGGTVLGDPDRTARILAADLSRWRLVLDPAGGWRLDRLQPTISDRLVALVDVARRQRVPAVLGSAHGGAFLTDPLVGDGTRVQVSPGGPRYVALTGSGTDPLHHVAMISERLPAQSLAVVHTAGERLHLEVWAAAERRLHLTYGRWPEREHPDLPREDPLRLEGVLGTWRDRGRLAVQAGRALIHAPLADIAAWQGADGPVSRMLTAWNPDAAAVDENLVAALERHYPYPMDGLEAGTGWGVLDAESLVATWRGKDEAAARRAAASLVAVPSSLLDPILLREVVPERFFDRAVELEAQPLLGRLLRRFPGPGIVWLGEHEGLGVELLGPTIIAYLAAELPLEDPRLRDAVRRCRHLPTLRALARRCQEPSHWLLAAHLRDRLQRQADGELPFDPPLVQHRLVAAVFGSPYLSPTPLRPLARALDEQLAGLVREPLERFFERHGRHR